MGVSVTVRSDGKGTITWGGLELQPDVSLKLDEDCRFALRQVDPIGNGHEQWMIFVYDLDGVRVGISVDRKGDYVICDDRAFPVGGPNNPFKPS